MPRHGGGGSQNTAPLLGSHDDLCGSDIDVPPNDGSSGGRRLSVADFAGVRTSVLDDDEAERALARVLSNPSANRCVLCRWLSATAVCAAAGAVLWCGCDWLFFASARMGSCYSGLPPTQIREGIEWFIGWAPGYLRVAILAFFAKHQCGKWTGYDDIASTPPAHSRTTRLR